MLRISKWHWPGAKHYSWRVQMGSTLVFTKVIYVRQESESSCFPHCKPPTSQSRGGVCSGQRYTAGTKAHTLIEFSAMEHSPEVVVRCVSITEQVHIYINESNNKALSRTEATKTSNKMFQYLMNLPEYSRVSSWNWCKTGELAIRGIYTWLSAQDDLAWSMVWILIWNLARTEEIAFSWYHCTTLQ